MIALSKLGGIVFGTTITTVYAYYVLGSYFSPLLNWLGPAFGAPLRFVMAFIFLFAGNPLGYVAVAAGWVIAGVSCGIFVRSVKGALGTALLVGIMLAVLLLVSLLGVAGSVAPIDQTISSFRFSGLHNVTAPSGPVKLPGFPPFPPGTSIASILREPLFNELAGFIAKLQSLSSHLAGSSSGQAAQKIVTQFFTSFILVLIIQSIERLALLLISAGVAGYLMRRLTTHLKARSAMREGNHGGLGQSGNKSKPLAAILLLVLFLAPVAHAFYTSTQSEELLPATLSGLGNHDSRTRFSPTGTSVLNYSEIAAALVTPDGSVANAFAVLSTSVQPTGSDSGAISELSQASLALVISQAGFSQYLPAEILPPSMQQYLTYLPGGLVIIGFDYSCSGVPPQAASVLSGISELTGLSGFTLLAAINTASITQSVSNSTFVLPSVCIAIYLTDTSMAKAAETLSTQLLPSMHDSGLIDLLSSGLSSGYLVPGETTGSVNANLFVAGFVNEQNLTAVAHGLFKWIPSNATSSITPLRGLGAFVVDASLKEGVFQSSNNGFSVTLSQAFNYNSPMSFAKDSSFSLLALGYPSGPGATLGITNLFNGGSGPSSSGGVTLISNYTFVAYLSQTLYPTAQAALNSTEISDGNKVTLLSVPPSETISPSSTLARFSYDFPPSIQFTKSLERAQGGKLQVVLSLKNLGSEGLNNVVVNDSLFVNDYLGGLQVTSGSTSESQYYLAPGQSMTLTYTVSLGGPGTYVSPPASATFSVNGTKYVEGTNYAYYHVGSPDAISAFYGTLASSGNFVFLATKVISGRSVTFGGTAFQFFALLLIVLGVLMEYRSFRKWKSTPYNPSRKEEKQPPSKSTPAPSPTNSLPPQSQSNQAVASNSVEQSTVANTQASEVAVCQQCGGSLSPGSIYCPNCGKKV